MTGWSLASEDEAEGRQDTAREEMEVGDRSWGGRGVCRVWED